MFFSAVAEQVLFDLPIRDKTLATYRSMYKNYIEPALGSLSLQDLNRSDIQRTIKDLPPQTAAMTLAVTKSILREAVSLNLLEESPALGVKPPKISPRKRPFLTVEELRNLDLGKYETQILFLACHGLRWGEAVALTEVDIVDGKIHVTKSIHGETKTPAGVRIVPQLSEFKPFPKSPKTLRRACAEYGIHIHSLRHSYAYLLKQSGVHVTTAQYLLGHSDPKVTLGIYTGFRESEISQAAEQMKLFANL